MSAVGTTQAIIFSLHWYFSLGWAKDHWIRPRHAKHPLNIRYSTSDTDVFLQIFGGLEYKCLDDIPGVRLVVDCGANVGYSSAYFLSQHPDCHVIAVEPDADNFAALCRNLHPYLGRVTMIRAGVWSHAARLTISDEPYRDSREWTRQVRECKTDEAGEMEGVNIGTLLAKSGFGRISILKVDVEGAEAVIFARNFETWLGKVDAIAIELHDDSTFGNGSSVFHSAIAGCGFSISRSGELTICRRE